MIEKIEESLNKYSDVFFVIAFIGFVFLAIYGLMSIVSENIRSDCLSYCNKTYGLVYANILNNSCYCGFLHPNGTITYFPTNKTYH